MRIAIHQPNFIPHFPFFYKMAMVDKFIILDTVQFEKNGWQNRCNVWDKWWTKPVKNGTSYICHKEYTDDRSLIDLNMLWIRAIKDTLNINTELIFTRESCIMRHLSEDRKVHKQDPKRKLIGIIRSERVDNPTYVTNPDAKDKYLDEDLMLEEGIMIEYCKVPRNLQKHTFEIFNEFGIVGAMKQLPRRGRSEKS